jgi:hypothetical protein
MAQSCNPDDLVAAAVCFACVPGEALDWAQIFLLCQIANQIP